MTEKDLRLRCLEMAMEIYRKSDVSHMRVENVAGRLWYFVETGGMIGCVSEGRDPSEAEETNDLDGGPMH